MLLNFVQNYDIMMARIFWRVAYILSFETLPFSVKNLIIIQCENGLGINEGNNEITKC